MTRHFRLIGVPQVIETLNTDGETIDREELQVLFRYLHHHQVNDMLEKAGLQEIEVFGDFDGSPLTDGQRRDGLHLSVEVTPDVRWLSWTGGGEGGGSTGSIPGARSSILANHSSAALDYRRKFRVLRE